MANIVIPQFWQTIENSLLIQPEGIRDIKLILTLLNYTTIQSIAKFTKLKEIKLIELEFLSRREEFSQVFPHLASFSFGSGASHILQDIASKTKKMFVIERNDIDFDQILQKVLADGKKVFIK